LVAKIKASYRFDITGSNGEKKSWLVNLKTGAGSVTESSEKADCIIAISDANYIALMGGKLNPMQAFMQGKLKIKGNMMLAQKLSLLMDAKPKM
jgi:3-hydroxyacyl-CoA dehydrogenase/3a,7a,12a-trihydroxy-5b-cholest-24-enoyl-CoA hydratase